MTWTVPKIKALKGAQKITALTAYDALSGRYADQAGIPLILVGDSLANTVLGYETTLPVTMDEMVHHTAAVSRGVSEGLVVADMPFMSYQGTLEHALENAGRFIKEAGADAVKIEGGTMRAELVEKLVANGIPVLGHIGLTPQSV
ncbi:MAG: 3-methyl-2-oxobutanoate hydroxymethyltransferase, partial [Kiritimatiellales bacterium]|nr:3-methyl-2-oxobutanoate hydroxymethyltransferase [Kiritimatiellales bacterium]